MTAPRKTTVCIVAREMAKDNYVKRVTGDTFQQVSPAQEPSFSPVATLHLSGSYYPYVHHCFFNIPGNATKAWFGRKECHTLRISPSMCLAAGNFRSLRCWFPTTLVRVRFP